jgi:hypothetical protein
VTRLEKLRSTPLQILLTAGILTGLLAGYVYIVAIFNFRDINLIASMVFVLGCLVGLIVGWRSFGVGFVLGSFVGVVFSFGWAFKDHDLIDLDQLRTLIGVGPSDQEWIQKADKMGIYLPQGASNVRFDDQSGTFVGVFRFEFKLDRESVKVLKTQKKLEKEIRFDLSQFKHRCKPSAGLVGQVISESRFYDITAFRTNNWQGTGSGITLGVSSDGSAHGCAYAAGSR